MKRHLKPSKKVEKYYKILKTIANYNLLLEAYANIPNWEELSKIKYPKKYREYDNIKLSFKIMQQKPSKHVNHSKHVLLNL